MSHLKWFDSGHISDAIVGDGHYFLRDHTYREDHAQHVVLQRLLEWAESHNRLAETRQGIEQAFTFLSEAGRLEEALRLALSYYLVDGASASIGVDPEWMATTLASAINSNAAELTRSESLRTLAIAVIERLPELAAHLPGVVP